MSRVVRGREYGTFPVVTVMNALTLNVSRKIADKRRKGWHLNSVFATGGIVYLVMWRCEE